MTKAYRSILLAGITVVVGTGCEEPDLRVPSAAEVAVYYEGTPGLSVEMSGNVAEITVVQPYAQVRRGGTLWAKVGPYIYLFTEETESLLVDFGGLAGVRVVTTTSSRGEVARAFLRRDAMTDVRWRRAKNIAGRARRDGTERPSLLEELVRWGEDHTEFSYSSRFVR
jgi:hypothetical protein